MSNLRVIGLAVGIIGLYLTFKIYRGPRWRRANFIFFGIFSLSIIVVSLNPDFLNTLAAIFSLRMEQRGRILTLLIFSNIFLWFLLLYFKTKLDKFGYQFDILIREIGYDESVELLRDKLADKEIGVIIPAYNEAQGLGELLKRIPSQIEGKKVGVIVIDDGSTDDTVGKVRQAGFLVAKNKVNRGQGGASRLGYDILLKHSNVKVGVTMDADGQHLPQEIHKLVRPVLNGEYDLVIGSRILGKKEKGTLLRSTGIHLLTRLINFLTGMSLTDCSSGFKAFNVSKMKALHLTEEQFQAAEIIIEAAKKGFTIGEVPITILERKHGLSKKGRDWLYGLGFIKTIFKSWWR